MLIPGVLSAEEPTYMLDSGFILLTWVYRHGETEKTSCPNFTELLMILRSYLSPLFFKTILPDQGLRVQSLW